MTNKKLEIELTQEQFEKLELLQNHGINPGQAIDLLFEIKDISLKEGNKYFEKRISEANIEKEMLEEKLDKINKEIDVYSKLKDDDLDINEKLKFLEEEYEELEETCDVNIQNTKSQISWARDFFYF